MPEERKRFHLVGELAINCSLKTAAERFSYCPPSQFKLNCSRGTLAAESGTRFAKKKIENDVFPCRSEKSNVCCSH